MAGRRNSTPQSQFWRGALSPRITAISHPKETVNGLRRGPNLRILKDGALSRRPGSVFVEHPADECVLFDYVTSDGEDWVVALSNGMLESFRLTDGFKTGELTGAPWATADLATLVATLDNDKIYLTSESFWPQVLQYTGSAWSTTDYAFAAGPGNSLLQPYYKFEDVKDITMSVSAYTGTGVTVTASDDFFTADHVGQRIRYGFRELQITAVATPTSATADVIDQLPDAFDVTVQDVTGFRVGEVVLGADSGCEAQILSITVGTNTFRCVVTNGFEGFTVGSPGEEIDGPNHTSKCTANVAVSTPPASLIWDEQFISTTRGFPRSCAMVQRRLCFADFPQKKDAIAFSAVNDVTDFDVEEGNSNSAILEFIKGERQVRVLYAVEAESVIVLGSDRIWWIDGVLTPDTISFKKIEQTGAAQVAPVVYGDTIVFVEQGQKKVMGVVPTGELRRPWRIDNLSRDYDQDLLGTVINLTQTSGNPQNPERYVFAVNSSGDISVLHTEITEERVRLYGWLPWTTQGAWKSLVSVKGTTYAALTRTISAADTWMIERFDYDRLIDSSPFSVDATTLLTIVTWDGDTLVDWTGDPFVTGFESLLHLAGETVAAIDGNRDLGDFTVEADGTIADASLAGVAYDAGLTFEPLGEFHVVRPDDSRRKGTRRIGVKKFALDFYETVGGTLHNDELPRQSWDSIDNDPTPFTGIFWARVLGVSFDGPSVVFSQPRPGSLTIRAAMAEVSY